ncbi:MAG: peptide ABC transporter permease [gamma proteobacterium symbiont of Ctena orbiculata]|nr:MAG: peptide ABC transporter permease [gamma proteobacterium symbiont of Ctena orbiculata]
MAILSLALKSLLNRRFTASLVLLSIALSVALLLGVERLRVESRNSFANTISGTDLVVGARSGAINLLLYSVFRIGDATNNISWKSYKKFSEHSLVKWTIPISLGDSHRGYRVMGTNRDYFRFYKYANKRSLSFHQGWPFEEVYQAVLGHEVAGELDYRMGQEIVIAHGAGKTSFTLHDDKPFKVVGILEPTGTPVDRTVHVPLEGIEAIHVDWVAGRQVRGLNISADEALEKDLTPKAITAFLVGLKSKIATFRVQREINDYRKEPLLAVLPGVALQQLWDLISVAENALLIITLLVVAVGLIGILTVMLASLNERRREMAILRSVGARPGHILLLVTGEGLLLSLIGIAAGLLLLYAGLFLAQTYIETHYGLHLPIGLPSLREWLILVLVGTSALIVGLIPGYRAYRYSLADGMSIRI